METTLSKEKNKQQLIKEIRERLDWYNFEASDEEFDENEVTALVELLKVLDTDAVAQVPDVDESFEKFKQYLELKREDAERLAVLRGERAAVSGSKVGAESKAGAGSKANAESKADAGAPHRGFTRRAYRYVAAAAVLAVVLVAGGTVGAVNAEKKGGVFQWLFKDDSGSVVLVSPNDNEGFDYTIPSIFYSEEDVPEKYQVYMPDVDEMESLEGYTLKEIEIQEMKQFSWISYKMDFKEKELLLRVTVYYDSVVVQSDQFDHYEYLDSIVLQDQEMEIYSKVDDSEQIDYIVSFFMNQQQYVIQGKQSLEFLEQIALECCRALMR